jgi:hypothetical protein
MRYAISWVVNFYKDTTRPFYKTAVTHGRRIGQYVGIWEHF